MITLLFRWFASLTLCYFVYTETGVATAFCIFLIFVSIELHDDRLNRHAVSILKSLHLINDTVDLIRTPGRKQ